MSFVALVVARGSLSIAAPASPAAPAAPAASAELEPLRVELNAPAACPATPSLLGRVRTHSARVREARPGEPARVLRVAVSPHEGGFVADLRLADESDEADEPLERRVPGKTCNEVLAAVALIAALAIDARPAEARASAGSADASDASLEAAPDGARRRRPPSEAGSFTTVTDTSDVHDANEAGGRSAHVAVAFGTSLEAHGLGEMVLGSALWIEGILPARLSPSLRLRFARGRSFTPGDDPRPAVFRLTTASLEPCFVAVEGHRLELRPCAQLTGGVLEGASAAFVPSTNEVRPWASLGALVQGRWHFLGPLALEVSFGFTVPLVRDDFYFRPKTAVYQAPPFVLAGNVGVGTTFR